MLQTDLFIIHKHENNPESQGNLDKSKKRFTKKCGIVYAWLMEGKEITVLWAANNTVSSLPRRIKDLRANGVIISDKWENGSKVYFMTQEQKTENKKIK